MGAQSAQSLEIVQNPNNILVCVRATLYTGLRLGIAVKAAENELGLALDFVELGVYLDIVNLEVASG